jgi:hypothetical protein
MEEDLKKDDAELMEWMKRKSGKPDGSGR